MIIQIKNIHIFFAVESVWGSLNYRLKYQINKLVEIDEKDETVQKVEISEPDLLQIFKAVSSQPEGVASKINQEILFDLIPQLMAEAQQGDEEAQRILYGVNEIDVDNKATKEAKILNGKNQILE